jgi:hypothetical protein
MRKLQIAQKNYSIIVVEDLLYSMTHNEQCFMHVGNCYSSAYNHC